MNPRFLGVSCFVAALSMAALVGCGGDDGSETTPGGGAATGGSSAGGSSAGGSSAGGKAAGGTSAGGQAAGGTSAGGAAAGGDTGSGGTAAGGDTGSGGTAAGGDTGAGGSAAGGDTGSGGMAAGGMAAGGMAAGGMAAGGGSSETFNVSLVGSGFDPHNGGTFGVALVENDKTIGSAFFPMGGGSWQVDWLGIPAGGKSYKAVYFADANNNGMCDPPDADHVWEQDLGKEAGNIEKSFTHDTTWTDACGKLFPDPATGVVLHGTGFDPHASGVFGFAVVDGAGKVLVRAITQLDATAAADFTVTFLGGGIAAGGKYKIHYFGDLNGDGQCTAPPDDHAWMTAELSPEAGAQAQVDVAHNTDWTDICSSFK